MPNKNKSKLALKDFIEQYPVNTKTDRDTILVSVKTNLDY